jgi:ATP-dependent helicase HrpB
LTPSVQALAEQLPIGEALPALLDALAERNCAVLVAPPGAGKTTVVPLALADEAWAQGGKLIVLEPRRLAARAAAARMAATLGERAGESVGYRVRLESRVSARTRIEVVTEGVFTRMILDDPTLDGVAAVLFDEFHERSLDADLGLAFAREAQSVLREDLRILVMSATLDGARIARLLGEAPVLESHGRAFPVETRYLGRDAQARIEDQMARAVTRALAAESGGVLAFLPGQGEILRTLGRLAQTVGGEVDIHPLYGALETADQDRAMAPAPPGRRKVVLATSIAQTSLTLDGVRVVVDSGLSRVPRWDPASGVTRLATTRVSRASADQRRGRAGRTEPGVCWRLWDEAETRGLLPFDRPEILEADLARLALDVARWGASDVDALALLDKPPRGAMSEAGRLLERLGALDHDGRLTARGRALADLPLAPRLAAMVVAGGELGAAERAAQLAAVLSERGLGGGGIDIGRRADSLSRDRGARARAALAMAQRWARAVRRGGKTDRRVSDGLLIASAFPDRIGRARGAAGEFQLASGRGAVLAATDPLSGEPWLAVAELAGGGERDRIVLAAALDIEALRAAAADLFTTKDRLVVTASGARRGQRVVSLGELEVEVREIAVDPRLIVQALLDEVRREGVGALPWGSGSRSFRERVAFLRGVDPRWPDLSDDALVDALDEWLAPLIEGRTALSQLGDAELESALRGVVPWSLLSRLDAEAPQRWTAPTGSSHAIDYAADGGPRVRVRVQELFGLRAHPTVGAGFPLALAMLSPAHREIQVTRDLPRFWAGSWADMRKDMRGRYPRHPWPEDPAAAAPTTRVKPRG